MYLKRKIEKELDMWYSTKKALVVDGARQVGKTYILKKYLSEKFENLIYINLLMDRTIVESLGNVKSSKEFLLKLSVIFGNDLYKDDTVIFFDEVQELYNYRYLNNLNSLDILTISKDLVQNTSLRYVFSGSLLGIEINDVLSYPVGYCDELHMYPLDFEEFLWANDVNNEVIELLKEAFYNRVEVPDYINDKILELYSKYILVGGMPEAVACFVEDNNFLRVDLVHKTLNDFILKDISKYASINDKLKIKEIYNLLPSELNSKSKRFRLSDINGIKRGDDTSLSFSWLNSAGVAIPVYSCVEPCVPLMINSQRNLLKLYHEDVGLLSSLILDKESKLKILSGELNINFGSIVENAVAMSLHAHGYDKIYYYNNKQHGELDFIVESYGKAIPIEIKSGKDYDRHLVLNNIQNIKNYHFDVAYVFYNGNYKYNGIVNYFPIYMVDFLKK